MALYIIPIPGSDRVKIGATTTSSSAIFTRYSTPYGEDITIYRFRHKRPFELEQKFANKFKHYNITRELYNRRQLNDYFDHLQSLGLNVEIYDKYNLRNYKPITYN